MSDQNRRPLTSRNSRWAAGLASRAVAKGISPNRISQASIGFAVLGFLLYWFSTLGGLLQFSALLLAAAAVQARLVCNLIDGMVAIEGGRGAKDGPFWNEAPDRASDLLFFAGAGLAAGQPALGLLAAALAIATAYIRELGRAEGFPPDFSGPLAKPQRMAVLTAGTILAALHATEWTLTLTLWIIALGTAATILRRSWTLIEKLKSR
ncbi:CDP-alcohol phosphatidyltransferase family protein [Rhodobacter calidifons]|uniref:CDP-alcohol phosphatidyltransferase family protein n=1 Tax=Rhodobacter calidifons TaxID=2715277 RepID=A0ABX0G9N6_9RHOB|nr:CDP-alcohol phosphatidyltransferase family protein [Rhodobacter calidifons]NHB77966.1 CDP-alcohol phosphatidyltransferase family protein [Rhodobacter calidifons]